jgi:hypothetical protein
VTWYFPSNFPSQAWGVAPPPAGREVFAGVSELTNAVSERSEDGEGSPDFAGGEASCGFPVDMIDLLTRVAGSTEDAGTDRRSPAPPKKETHSYLTGSMKVQFNYVAEHRNQPGATVGWINGFGLRAAYDF